MIWLAALAGRRDLEPTQASQSDEDTVDWEPLATMPTRWPKAITTVQGPFWLLVRLTDDGRVNFAEWFDGRAVVHQSREGARKALHQVQHDLRTYVVSIEDAPPWLHVLD